MDAAQRSADIALAQYREGATDYQRVVDAQRQLLEQQNNLASASSSVATSVIALYKALGGGWEMQGAADGSRSDAAGNAATNQLGQHAVAATHRHR